MQNFYKTMHMKALGKSVMDLCKHTALPALAFYSRLVISSASLMLAVNHVV